MSTLHNLFDTLQTFEVGDGRRGAFYSLPRLEQAGLGPISRLPVSIRLVLESVLRNCDGRRVPESAIRSLAAWQPRAPRTEEIPFVVARIVLQDFTGVPLLVDLAAMRSAVARMGRDPRLIEPLVPVDLVVDHSVQVDVYGTSDALRRNLELEFARNRERYEFLKWGTQAFRTFRVIPPGIGIIHQVNLEYLARGVLQGPGPSEDTPLYYPDTLVGTDSHTTMINGLGIVGWGVGGIEAEAGMLGQPVYFLTPDVVGVYLTGSLPEGSTATDLALTLTQLLRRTKVVGKFVEFFGPGAAALPVVDRATIANMAPEYGATMGFFPIDEKCVEYLRATGRSEEHCRLYEAYYRAQGLWGMPQPGQVEYSQVVELDLGTVTPSVAGPKRPQDRIELPDLEREFFRALQKPVTDGGFGKSRREYGRSVTVRTSRGRRAEVGTGRVLIAAITSCTNTSNPTVMLAAGLLARKAVERGLRVPAGVKTSLAPGSRVVSEYLKRTGLQKYLNRLGFQVVGYGCTTCIGNSGPLDPAIEQALQQHDFVAAAVLSGNRNFEARIHPAIKANFLMSPPLVVAFALAGRVDIDMSCEPIGFDREGAPVFLADLWPTAEELRQALAEAVRPELFRKLYRDFSRQNPQWNEIPAPTGLVYEWSPRSTYIQEPPFFENFTLEPPGIQPLVGARVLGIFGDSVTTDHISPAGAIKKDSPAGRYLLEQGVDFADFNSYGSRRGNDRVMTRGTFANVRIKNLMLGGEEGGYTLLQPDGVKMFIYDAAMEYQRRGVPLVVIAGHEYGTGSSRDWAAKGTRLLGVRAVIARSFERIHRSNLVGMGVLPLQFPEGVSAQTLGLNGTELYDVPDLGPQLQPQQRLTLRIRRADGREETVPVQCRIDTPIEIDYYRHGGILPYVLRQLLSASTGPA
ncbi:aconitate hydratase AcnA [Limisphaera ngatamarikiensis]|uniref:Aconitate hydratase n=1 Tax=Limisphaera ngatamarikiensis TaxID=1324935 RepID=A0A6M1S4Z4_9BACT|nr:aconitate hydratase AcnA [Limisphaera ngatamarikiensis]NGO40340.1 aconitate hydratase AcnA [Limisphaera ngatamarikiensis]